jgi:thioredoxin-related protein
MFMKRISFLIFFLIPLILFSQKDTLEKGIKWTEGLSWEQIKQKAKQENKYIFVDCFATWCVPCKNMDSLVYSQSSVGTFINQEFISLRLQFDSTKYDDNWIRENYSLAKLFSEKYNISSFPTFLFFSPEGDPVHKDVGFKKDEVFSSVAKNSLQPKKQYYTLLKAYRNGERDFEHMAYLANLAQSLKEIKLADTIAQDYINNYLFKLSDSALYTKVNMNFTASFTTSSNQKSFSFFFDQSAKVDQLMRFGFAQRRVDYVINREEINPHIKIDKVNYRPPWNRIFKSIKDKYGVVCAERNIINAKLSFFERVNNWKDYSKYCIKKVEKYGQDAIPSFPPERGNFAINFYAWELFVHSNNKKEVRKGIGWMKKIMQSADSADAGYIDTYANLLYKVGKKKDAVYWEEKAAIIEQENAKKNHNEPNKQILDALRNMKSHQTSLGQISCSHGNFNVQLLFNK